MASLAYGTSAYSRARGNMPELPLINLFVEASPTSSSQVVLQSRPGLAASYEVGTGPIRGLFQTDGVLGGSTIAVSGSEVYKGGTLLGSLPGDGPVSFAANETELLINAGAGIYRTDGVGLTLVSFPDGAAVSRLASLGGYFIAVRSATQQLYFSVVGDGETWAALDYASAENDPDALRDMLVVNDTLFLFGSQTVEFWAKTGDADAPFAPIEGRVFPKGVIATGCAVKFDNSVAWLGPSGPMPSGVTPSLRVYIAGNIAEGISDPGIEERLSNSLHFALWTFTFEGHEFLVVRMDDHSMLFDAQTKQWCEFTSYGRDNWQCQNAVGGLFGDDEDGIIWRFRDGFADGTDSPLERRFRAGYPLSGGTITANNIRLTVNVGETQDLSGYSSDPVVEMRTSRDGGRTWGTWQSTKLGAVGNYRTRCEWRRLGMFDDPGVLAEFRTVDPVPFRISAVGVNEEGGGRSR